MPQINAPLVTLSGKVSWPQAEENHLSRGYMSVADVANLIYLMLCLNKLVVQKKNCQNKPSLRSIRAAYQQDFSLITK